MLDLIIIIIELHLTVIWKTSSVMLIFFCWQLIHCCAMIWPTRIEHVVQNHTKRTCFGWNMIHGAPPQKVILHFNRLCYVYWAPRLRCSLKSTFNLTVQSQSARPAGERSLGSGLHRKGSRHYHPWWWHRERSPRPDTELCEYFPHISKVWKPA